MAHFIKRTWRKLSKHKSVPIGHATLQGDDCWTCVITKEEIEKFVNKIDDNHELSTEEVMYVYT